MMRQFRLLCPFSLCPLWLKFSSSLKISPLRVASVEMTTFLLEPGNGDVIDLYIKKLYPQLCGLCVFSLPSVVKNLVLV
jgi:hypothetical protein